MKVLLKSTLILGLSIFALGSCKKDYSCACTIDGTQNAPFEYTNMEEEAAEAACTADEYLLQQDNPTAVVACTLN
jgi:hypothetical protein